MWIFVFSLHDRLMDVKKVLKCLLSAKLRFCCALRAKTPNEKKSEEVDHRDGKRIPPKI